MIKTAIAPLVSNPPPANSTTDTDTDTDTHPLGYGDHMVNLIFGDNRRSLMDPWGTLFSESLTCLYVLTKNVHIYFTTVLSHCAKQHPNYSEQYCLWTLVHMKSFFFFWYTGTEIQYVFLLSIVITMSSIYRKITNWGLNKRTHIYFECIF